MEKWSYRSKRPLCKNESSKQTEETHPVLNGTYLQGAATSQNTVH